MKYHETFRLTLVASHPSKDHGIFLGKFEKDQAIPYDDCDSQEG
jgi:hypothetical protein